MQIFTIFVYLAVWTKNRHEVVVTTNFPYFLTLFSYHIHCRIKVCEIWLLFIIIFLKISFNNVYLKNKIDNFFHNIYLHKILKKKFKPKNIIKI